MKLTIIRQLFPNIELLSVMLGDRISDERIERGTLIQNLLKVKNSELYIKMFEESLLSNQSLHPRTCADLQKRLTHALSNHGSTIPRLLKTAAISQSPAPSFPNENLAILRERATRLKMNTYAEASSLISEISTRSRAMVKSKPSLAPYQEQMLKQATNREDASEIGKAGHFSNWSDVNTPYQNFRHCGCPATQNDIAALFTGVIMDKIQVLVSLHQKGEAKNTRCSNFWENEHLRKISTSEWSVKKIGETVLASSEKNKQPFPRIIESTLLLTNRSETRTITHLHYDGWKDAGPISSTSLFTTLLDTIEARNPSQSTRITINCIYGCGRTGTTAVAYYIRRYIDQQLKLGTSLANIEINIPEIILAFRAQRKGSVDTGSHLALLYSATATYYERLNAASAHVVANELTS